MTNNDILRMAVEAGFADAQGVVHAAYQLEAFANLVAAHEREQCALVCEDLPAPPDVPRDRATVWDVATLDCAAAIRQRSQS
jgi:hypothetical protein